MAPLKIQSFGFNGVDFENGQLTIDPSGNLITQGTITAATISAENIKANKLSITEDTTSSQSAVLSTSVGTVVIPAGDTSIDVSTSALTSKSVIFATPQKPVEYGVEAINSNTFRITFQQAQTVDIKVNWWIVN